MESHLFPGHEERMQAHEVRVMAYIVRFEGLSIEVLEARYQNALACDQHRIDARRQRHKAEYAAMDEAKREKRRQRDRERERSKSQNSRRRELYAQRKLKEDRP